MYEVVIKGGFPWTHYDKLHIHGKKNKQTNNKTVHVKWMLIALLWPCLYTINICLSPYDCV